jgi:molybdopterin synthase catalytic subunit
MAQIKVLLFASLKEQAGTANLLLEVPGTTSVAQFKEVIAAKFPKLAPGMHTAIVSVNHEFAFDEDRIPDGAEVAVFPPVSGGNDFPTIIQLTNSELDLDYLLAQITLETTGAACFFTGMVRGKTTRGQGYETSRLEYEAYIPMAEAKMRQVAEEIRTAWPAIEGIAIVQRIGVLKPQTPTVLIACTAAHRDSGAFEAARYGIDRLKEIVPIWKKEVGPQGETWVEGEYVPGRED